MDTLPAIVDCDPGLDDALALLLVLASPELELLGVTTVAGNQTVDKTTANALRVLELAGREDVRVARGADRPLVGELVVADEPVRALDVSGRAQILALLRDLQQQLGLTLLFVSHDLAVIRQISDDVAVMYLGRIQEVGPTDDVFNGPNHPYTEALLSAIPSVDGEATTRIRLEGEIPSPANPPSGCVFHPRCPRVIPGVCEITEPPLLEVSPGHAMRCHIPIEELIVLQRKPLSRWAPVNEE